METKEVVTRQLNENLNADSVELTKNTKGFNYSVKIYGNVTTGLIEIIKKLDEAVIILEGKYGNKEQ